ncbi:FAD-dependent monooxygenase [Streptomyces peucetius]|nr:hypothetical protein CGZ69_18530 [Streptomyces peucetius subsp. caesius ATCC 27952]
MCWSCVRGRPAARRASRGRWYARRRGTELLDPTPEDEGVSCPLRHRDGSEESVQARHVVGCEGARSTVRERAGIGF